MAESFTTDFKRFFGRGLGILLPTIVTLWILWQAFSFVYTNVAEPINRATRLSVLWVMPQVVDNAKLPDWYDISEEEILVARASGRYRPTTPIATIERDIRREWLRQYWSERWYLNFAGFFIAILLIYLAGLLLGNFFGRQIYHRVERLIAKIPGFKQVYPHVKQVVDLILGEKKMAFSKVVLVEYPSKDIWTMGFLTGDSLRSIDQSAGGRVVSVFIPTSPTPFTGFTINVLASALKPMDVSMEEALRFVITAGVLTPETASKDPARMPAAAVVAEQAAEVVRPEEPDREEAQSPPPERNQKSA
jgi:uncharacterized membrane protein|tara:strand:+ start:13543 stop:14457 length:915 start_codon:yes stop_codon:yes gene_type:complete